MYFRQVWDKSELLYEDQRGFRPRYSCEGRIVTFFQDIADSLDEGARIDAIITDFSNSFDLVPHDQLLTKIAASGVDWRVVISVREFLLGRSQRGRWEGNYLMKSEKRQEYRKGTAGPTSVPRLRK
jgi:hypothetical protein